MQTSFKISASNSTSIFDVLRKFSPIKYQQGGVGQEQNIEPNPPTPPIPPVPPNIEYEIGDFAQGGVVIWVTDDKQHGLVASIVNLGPKTGPNPYTLTWGPQDVDTGAINNQPLPQVYTNPFPAANYGGYKNQKAIEALSNWRDDYPAFAAAADYAILIGDFIYDGWFLPTLTELEQIYEQRDIVNTVSQKYKGDPLILDESDHSNFGYWSSLEVIFNQAWYLHFFNGGKYNDSKEAHHAVRCVWAF